MAAHAVSVGDEDDCLSVGSPLGRLAKIATAANVCGFSALSTYNGYVAVWLMPVGYYLQGKPFAVRTPAVGEFS